MGDAYQDLQRVVDEIHARGVGEVQWDLITALPFAEAEPQSTHPTAGETYYETIHQQLSTIHLLLQREAHSLRRESSKTHLAQQLAYRIADRGLNVLKNGAQNLIANAGDAMFVRSWANRNESLALERTFMCNQGAILSVEAFAKGHKAISGSSDNTLKVWNLQTGEEEMTLIGHQESVNSVSIIKNSINSSCKAISASSDNTLKVWNLQTGEEEMTLIGHKGAVLSVKVFDCERMAVSGSEDKTIKVWDLQTGKEEMTLVGHQGAIFSVAAFGAGTAGKCSVISASNDRTVRVWNLQTGNADMILRGYQSSVNHIEFIDEGRKVISAAGDPRQEGDKSLKVWNLQTGKEEMTLFGHQHCVSSLAVLNSGRNIVSGSYDGTIKVWNLETDKENMNPSDIKEKYCQ